MTAFDTFGGSGDMGLNSTSGFNLGGASANTSTSPYRNAGWGQTAVGIGLNILGDFSQTNSIAQGYFGTMHSLARAKGEVIKTGSALSRQHNVAMKNTIASRINAMAVAGVETSSGTAMDILEATTREMALAKMMDAYNVKAKVAGYDEQYADYKAAHDEAHMAAKDKMFGEIWGSILGGFFGGPEGAKQGGEFGGNLLEGWGK